MSPETARLVRMGLSSLMAGAMGVGTNILTVMTTSGVVSHSALTIALLSGALMAAKDLSAYLAQPPTTAKGA